jgi:3-methyladenine DNA glycosylase Mpg
MHYLVNVVTEPEGSPAAVLIRALGITLAQNCLDLTRGPLRIEDRGLARDRRVVWTRRIGINVGVEQEWRVTDAGSRAVSGTRARLRA